MYDHEIEMGVQRAQSRSINARGNVDGRGTCMVTEHEWAWSAHGSEASMNGRESCMVTKYERAWRVYSHGT